MIIVLKNLVNKEEMYLTLIFGDIKFTNDISIAANFDMEEGVRLVSQWSNNLRTKCNILYIILISLLNWKEGKFFEEKPVIKIRWRWL